MAGELKMQFLRQFIGITLAVMFLTSGCTSSDAQPSFVGAGASFPGPVYRAWAAACSTSMNIDIRYEEVGSSEGIARIKSGAVDFGASDIPLGDEELKRHRLVQVPVLIGGVAIIMNLSGIKTGDLVFSDDALADIFLGNIRKWSAPAIKKLNPEVRLPERPITIVHRSDGSGTTWLFTSYLNKVSDKWRAGPGGGARVEWPAGLGAERNAGVLRKVMETPGSIGYVEYTFAREAGISRAGLINASGNIATPCIKSFSAAISSVKTEAVKNSTLDLLDQPGEGSWPITGATYLLLREQTRKTAKTKALVRFLTWCYDEGGEIALRLHYIPLPDEWAEASIKTLRARLLPAS